MRSSCLCILLSSVLLTFLTGCHKKKAGRDAEASEIKIQALKAQHTLKSNKNLLLGLPIRLKYDGKIRHLFIQDEAQQKVIEIDDSSNIIHTFGKKGRGPGELQNIENFFITSENLYTVDANQFLINKYSRRDGHYISSLDYGKYLIKEKISKNEPTPPPPIPWMDNNNKLFVTQRGTILIPTQTDGKYLYKEISWEGKKLANIGSIPKGYSPARNNDNYWSTLENKNIPPRDLAEVFPINDCSNPDDIYFVYSAIPKITKYNLSGRKIWEHKISRTPEVDTLIINLGIRAKVVKDHPNVRVSLIPIRKYITGRCSPDGNLYLTTYTDPTMPDKYHQPMWVHEFDSKGKLMKRYKIVSDADVSYYPAIDFRRHRIFVSSVDHSGIRIYHF